jgi:predicted nucleic acid-binding protein
LRTLSFWILLTNTLDALHRQALELLQSLRLPLIVTTEQVITGILNFFADWGEHFRRKAAVNVRGALSLPTVKIIPHTRESFLAGLALHEARSDKGYSLTDCTSMQAMFF